jgi:hypothetical protein
VTINGNGTPTGVEEVANDKASSTKVLRNGMLLIKKGDKTYNVMGAEIK